MGNLTFGIWIGYKKKNLWIFFQNYGFIRKIEPFHLRMKHNIIQMTAMVGLTVPHLINPIFHYIFDYLGFNPMNGNFGFVFQGPNRLWMVSVTFILNGSPQKIIQWGQITASKRPIDIRISADYSIFENGARKIDYYVDCVTSGPVLLKPNVVHVILFNFWKQKFVEHGTVTLAIDPNGGSLLIFEKKWPNYATVPIQIPNVRWSTLYTSQIYCQN